MADCRVPLIVGLRRWRASTRPLLAVRMCSGSALVEADLAALATALAQRASLAVRLSDDL